MVELVTLVPAEHLLVCLSPYTRAGAARAVRFLTPTHPHCLQESFLWLGDFYKRNHSNPPVSMSFLVRGFFSSPFKFYISIQLFFSIWKGPYESSTHNTLYSTSCLMVPFCWRLFPGHAHGISRSYTQQTWKSHHKDLLDHKRCLLLQALLRSIGHIVLRELKFATWLRPGGPVQ